jgi:dolichyl-phosphate beta-glucosyltransferase
MGKLSKTCLIVPCYNEANRIDIDAFRKGGADLFQLIFVNDGSSDDTYELLCKHREKNWTIVDLKENVGKAEAVRRGMLHLSEQVFFSEVEWVGFWDADLATPLGEVERFITYSDTFFQDTNAIIGSRINRLGGNIKRSRARHYLGRIFITAVDTLFKLGCYDTQCGAKLFRAGIVAQLFEASFISRWIFDVELLLRLKKTKVVNIIEYPLMEWHDVQGSKLVLHRTVFRVVWDMVCIYRHYVL